MRRLVFSAFVVCCWLPVQSQKPASPKKQFRENIPHAAVAEQTWWNLLHYHISLSPDYAKKFISGSNTIRFEALESGRSLQIDLQKPMEILQATWKNRPLELKRIRDDAYLIIFPAEIRKGQIDSIKVYFSGHPKEALDAPNDSGWIWAKDEKGRPWMTIACQGAGASIWLPCKDVLYDEPDQGAWFSITVPSELVAVSNGRFQQKTDKGKTTTYSWSVVNPINNYNIIPYIGHYIHWQSTYRGLNGKLDCSYWVLDYNLQKGKKHFLQADSMLKAFEYWMGPYPFYQDGYKLVEAPFSGMEHQSAVAYGNKFQNGFKGRDFISGTKWSMKWDFMIIHESGHEWFGNNITCNNYGDTWIHEAFTKYLETLYTDYFFGKEAGNEYALGTWKRIKNDKPILGTGTTDKYYKGSAMLHMVRQIVGDSLFRQLLTGLNRDYYHATVNSKQIFDYINKYSGKDLSSLFGQYLQTVQKPVLEYFYKNHQLHYRWKNCITGFNMPVEISPDGNGPGFIYPTTNWQLLETSAPQSGELIVSKNYYISVEKSRQD